MQDFVGVGSKYSNPQPPSVSYADRHLTARAGLLAYVGATEARERLNVPEQDWQSFEERPFGLVRALVEQVS